MTTSTTHHGIIVAVDGSPASNVAVEWAAREAALRKESLTLVHVLPAPLITMWPEPLRTRAHQREFYERHGHQIIDDAVAVAEQSGVHLASFEHRTFSGNTLPTLIDLSKDAAMVVVGCRGRDDDDRPILGSIPTGLIRHAHCPVAIVHDEVQPLATAPVLVGVDGSPTSDQATAIAFDEASRRQVGLIAMHSWGEYGPYQVPMIDWEEQLGEERRPWPNTWPSGSSGIRTSPSSDAWCTASRRTNCWRHRRPRNSPSSEATAAAGSRGCCSDPSVPQSCRRSGHR